MVTFCCDSCGESFKKQKVKDHISRGKCRNSTVSCLDCNATFKDLEFEMHTACKSENEKYQGSLYKEIPKKKENNNSKKNNKSSNLQTPTVEILPSKPVLVEQVSLVINPVNPVINTINPVSSNLPGSDSESKLTSTDSGSNNNNNGDEKGGNNNAVLQYLLSSIDFNWKKEIRKILKSNDSNNNNKEKKEKEKEKESKKKKRIRMKEKEVIEKLENVFLFKIKKEIDNSFITTTKKKFFFYFYFFFFYFRLFIYPLFFVFV
jgi:cell growth-regulating nucleolar protein